MIASHPELMKMVRFVVLTLAVSVASTFAGEIYGTIKEGEKPVGKGVSLEVKM
jgi:hypothetical protein